MFLRELSTGAKISLIGYTTSMWDSPEDITEYAARVCYNSVHNMGKYDAFIQRRIKEGHESVIEHFSATFLIDGISRVCAQQLTRYRLASYSMESQRYVDLTGEILEEARKNFESPRRIVERFCVIPPDADDAYIWCLYDSLMGYVKAREHMSKEDARGLLPLFTRTKLVMTANAREYRHIIKQRTKKAAQWEIRELAHAMLGVLVEVAPELFKDLLEG